MPLVLVCGPRNWRHGVPMIGRRLAKLPPGSRIIHGGARGVDTYAALYAHALGIPAEAYLPAYRPSAGKPEPLERNDFMLELGPDLVLAFWNGASSGTRYVIEQARRRGIPLEVIRP